MKKLGLIIFILFYGLNIFAQSEPSINLSIRVGANAFNSTWDVKSDLVEKKAKIGFQGGVLIDYNLPNIFDLQTGLLLITKGAKLKIKGQKINETSQTSDNEQTLNQIYLQMPIHAIYRMYITNNTCIYFNLGPYMAYGLGGKNKVKTNSNSETTEEDTFSNSGNLSYGNLKKFDFGLSGGVGMEINRITFGVSSELGLLNLSNNSSYKYKNIGSQLTVGYKF